MPIMCATKIRNDSNSPRNDMNYPSPSAICEVHIGYKSGQKNEKAMVAASGAAQQTTKTSCSLESDGRNEKTMKEGSSFPSLHDINTDHVAHSSASSSTVKQNSSTAGHVETVSTPPPTLAIQNRKRKFEDLSPCASRGREPEDETEPSEEAGKPTTAATCIGTINAATILNDGSSMGTDVILNEEKRNSSSHDNADVEHSRDEAALLDSSSLLPPTKKRRSRRTLYIEYWSRSDECKERKWDHLDEIADRYGCAEDHIFDTTLYCRNSFLEPNMFPYDTPSGIEHWTLWHIKELDHEDIKEYVENWIDLNAPHVRRWNYDDNPERSIDIFHVHVYFQVEDNDSVLRGRHVEDLQHGTWEAEQYPLPQRYTQVKLYQHDDQLEVADNHLTGAVDEKLPLVESYVPPTNSMEMSVNADHAVDNSTDSGSLVPPSTT